MIDHSLSFIIGAVIAGVFSLLMSIKNIFKKDIAILNKKLDSIIEAGNVKYPNDRVVSSSVTGMVLDGRDEDAINQVMKETGCLKENAVKYVSNLKTNLIK